MRRAILAIVMLTSSCAPSALTQQRLNACVAINCPHAYFLQAKAQQEANSRTALLLLAPLLITALILEAKTGVVYYGQ